MSRAVHEDLPKPDATVNRKLAFAVFAPPVVWFLHLITGVAIVGRHCGAGLAWWQWAAYVGISLAAAVVAVLAGMTAYRIFRAWTRNGSPTAAQGWNRVEFVSLMGLFISVLLLLNIIYFGVMPFVVEPCVRTI